MPTKTYPHSRMRFNLSLRWHYPNQVIGLDDYSPLSACCGKLPFFYTATIITDFVALCTPEIRMRSVFYSASAVTLQSPFAKSLLRSFPFAHVAFSPNKFAKMCSLMQALLAHFMQICLALNSYFCEIHNQRGIPKGKKSVFLLHSLLVGMQHMFPSRKCGNQHH